LAREWKRRTEGLEDEDDEKLSAWGNLADALVGQGNDAEVGLLVG
jgi:hypothetical protein